MREGPWFSRPWAGEVRALGRPQHSPSWEPEPSGGEDGLIKVWAFPPHPHALPAHWTCLLVLAPAGHGPSPTSVAFPDQPVLGVGLGDSCPTLGSTQASFSLSASLSPAPSHARRTLGLVCFQDLLEEERG